ncbi:hypothetical protein Sfum_3964 [Syntrophobacter fumaroxidans MPOB]|uniref:Uncharacterized protein n=1 Tax=Syntrophobacter fumaroxidans (strain DSM 10017 / MPOB) TaxID=335543 RepID=A0LQC9_SYNFM|nr:hypothetical protein Sfum_3964 [Syntrophobacter fumaroxidans MPOB]
MILRVGQVRNRPAEGRIERRLSSPRVESAPDCPDRPDAVLEPGAIETDPGQPHPDPCDTGVNRPSGKSADRKPTAKTELYCSSDLFVSASRRCAAKFR